MQELSTEEPLVGRFIEALEATPETSAHVVQREKSDSLGHADAIIEATVGGEPMRFIVEAKRSAFPRDVREAIWQLRKIVDILGPTGIQLVPMIIADSISPGAKALLREERVGLL